MTVDTWEMVLVHRVFRQEFRTLPGLVSAVQPGDRARTETLAGHVTDVTGALHHHHLAEDELLWPPLLSRAGLHAELAHRMRAQHSRLHELLQSTDATVARWRASAAAPERDELASLITQASAALDEHLTDEENEVLPLVEEHMTAAEWDAVTRRGQEAIPKNAKAFLFIGLIIEQATPQETTRFLNQLPLPVRLAWRAAGDRMYARAKTRIRGTTSTTGS